MSRQIVQLPAIAQSEKTPWSRRIGDRGSRALKDVGVLGIRCLDSLLRRCLGIREFSRHPDCVLRVSAKQARSSMVLSDNASVSRGTQIVELHLWNDRLSRCRRDESLFEWTIGLKRRIRLSLMLLADQVGRDEKFAGVKAVYARLPTPLNHPARVFRRLGFTVPYSQHSLGQSAHDSLQNALIWGLMWAFHPRGAQKENLVLSRTELWLSIPDLKRLYGDPIPSNEEIPEPGGPSDATPPMDDKTH